MADQKPSAGAGFFASIASSLSNFGTAMHKSVNGLIGYEGLEVINPEGGIEDAEVEAQRGRWKQEDRDSYWKMMHKYIGSDITSLVTLPVLIFEPMSMLQKMAELMEYSHLLDLADECEDPHMRLVYASCWFISVYYAMQRMWKPFNPILGEPYEMTNHGGIRFIAEQVSHHPPMGAAHSESEHFIYDITSKVKTKFLGNSLDVYPVGRTRLTLKKTGVELELVPPPSKVNNLIFGRTWVDSPGEMVLTNLTTKDKVVLYFQPCGWFVTGRYEVDGYVYNAAEEPKVSVYSPLNCAMSLLDQLWDDTVAGPRPETGLGKLRKQSSFGFRSNNPGKESDGGSANATENPVRVTRSIMILKPPTLGDQNGTPPASPAGSAPPVSPLSGGGSFRFRRRTASETYEKATGIGSRSPRPPYDL